MTTVPHHPARRILAVDFLQIDTILDKRIYVFIGIEHATRWVHLLGLTQHPTGPWVTQQVPNLPRVGCMAAEATIKLTRNTRDRLAELAKEQGLNIGGLPTTSASATPRTWSRPPVTTTRPSTPRSCACWLVEEVDSLHPVSLASTDIVEIGTTLPGRELATAHTIHQAIPGGSWPIGRAVDCAVTLQSTGLRAAATVWARLLTSAGRTRHWALPAAGAAMPSNQGIQARQKLFQRLDVDSVGVRDLPCCGWEPIVDGHDVRELLSG